MLRLLDRAHIASATLVGHSYGGMVIAAAAGRARRRVSRLVHLDTYVPRDRESCSSSRAQVPRCHEFIYCSGWALTAVGYLLAGAGFGVLVPGVTNIAMRDVPAGVSGAASGVGRRQYLPPDRHLGRASMTSCPSTDVRHQACPNSPARPNSTSLRYIGQRVQCYRSRMYLSAASVDAEPLHQGAQPASVTFTHVDPTVLSLVPRPSSVC